VSNLGLPVAPEEDLLATGAAETDAILQAVTDYDESFDISGSPVLDIGCGPGRILIPMAEQGADAYGIDASKGFLSQCQANATDRDLSLTLARTDDIIYDFGTKFSLVLCVKTFQSFRRRLTLTYLQQAYDHLATGGILYATVADLESETNQRALFREELDDKNPFRNRFFTREEVRIYLDYIGYRDVQFRTLDEGSVRDQFAVLARR
jgi:cyclopropane fatty-acyl-phospholipid synthase-like methyltransferase